MLSRVVLGVVFISWRGQLLPASLTEPDPFSVHSSLSLYTDVALFFFFVLLKNIGELASEACAREHYLALAVNKSPAVYILSPALDGLNLVPRFSLLPWERGYDGLKGL